MESSHSEPELWEPDTVMTAGDFSPPHSDGSDDASVVCTDFEKLERLENAARAIIQGIGEDPDREGLRDTPKVMAVFDV